MKISEVEKRIKTEIFTLRATKRNIIFSLGNAYTFTHNVEIVVAVKVGSPSVERIPGYFRFTMVLCSRPD